MRFIFTKFTEAVRKLQIPWPTIHYVLLRYLYQYAIVYKHLCQILVWWKELSYVWCWRAWVSHMFVFSDKTKSHAGQLNIHDVEIWGSENSNAFMELEKKSKNEYVVWCTEYLDHFSSVRTVMTDAYMNFYVNMLSHSRNWTWYSSGTPPHWRWCIWNFLNTHSQQGGLVEVVEFNDHPVPWMPHVWIFLYEDMRLILFVKQRCMSSITWNLGTSTEVAYFNQYKGHVAVHMVWTKVVACNKLCTYLSFVIKINNFSICSHLFAQSCLSELDTPSSLYVKSCSSQFY